MLRQGKKHSPDAKKSGHETSLRQGHPGTTFWWNEKKASGGSVDKDFSTHRGEKTGGATGPGPGPRCV